METNWTLEGVFWRPRILRILEGGGGEEAWDPPWYYGLIFSAYDLTGVEGEKGPRDPPWYYRLIFSAYDFTGVE